MRRLLISCIALCLPVLLTSLGASTDWRTDYEKSDYKATPRYTATVAYCQRLADASPWVRYSSFGRSPQGRSLPLLIVDRRGQFTPEAVRKSGNAVLLIQAGIHSGEIDGKDAGLMLIRDITISKTLADLLEHVTILFIPIFNVDGHERFGPYNRINQNGPKEMGWRVTAQNLNLNRDYLKVDAPEMQDWLQLFGEWLPDFFIDCHVTDGADYQYVVTYGLETHGNMDPGLTEWTRDVYLRTAERKMADAGFPICPYAIFRKNNEPKSGLQSWVAPPRLSQGYTAIQNRPGLLIETHMLKDYKTRVDGTYQMLRCTLEILNQEYKNLLRLNRAADQLAAAPKFRREPFPVQFRATSDSTMIDFLGYEYAVAKSDISGGPWYQYTDKPVTFRIPYFNKMEPSRTIDLPAAYIVPPEWQEVIRRLEIHGVRIKRLVEPATVEVNSYRFDNVSWSPSPYEGRHALRFESHPVTETRTFPAGSAVIDMNQRAARVAAHILEPDAPDSYLSWGFFDTIFEQKEYTETYVMEKMAREMMEKDPSLRKEYEQALAADSTLYGAQWRVLNWFYRRTPYWDDRKDVYPVGKITSRATVEALELR